MAEMQHPDLIAEVERLLDHHNGRCRTRLLDAAAVLCLLRHVAEDGLAWSSVDGGTVANAYKYAATTTIAFAGRGSDGRVGLGVRTCDANKASPGRAWHRLQYLGNCGPAKTQARIDEWIKKDADVVLGPDGEWWPEAPATIVERGITA